MSNLKELREELLSELAMRLSTLDFRRKGQDYYKDAGASKHIIHTSFINHALDFGVVANVAVRIDALDTLVNTFNPNLSKREAKQTASIGVELGQLATGRQQRWTVASPDDILGVCTNVMLAIESVGLPFMERYSSVEEILAVVSHDDEAAQLLSPLRSARAKRAIASAFLLGMREHFDQLVEEKTRYLANHHDIGLAQFTHMANILSIQWESDPQSFIVT